MRRSVVDALAEQGVIAGVAMSRLNPHAGMDDVLIACATEMNTDEDIAAYVTALKEVLYERKASLERRLQLLRAR